MRLACRSASLGGMISVRARSGAEVTGVPNVGPVVSSGTVRRRAGRGRARDRSRVLEPAETTCWSFRAESCRSCGRESDQSFSDGSRFLHLSADIKETWSLAPTAG